MPPYFLLQCPLPPRLLFHLFLPLSTSTIPYEIKEFRPHHAYPSHVLLIILEPVDEWAYSGRKKFHGGTESRREQKSNRVQPVTIGGETSGEELEFLDGLKFTRASFPRFIFLVSRIEYRCARVSRVLIFLLKIFGIEFLVHDEILVKSWLQSIIIDTKWTRNDVWFLSSQNRRIKMDGCFTTCYEEEVFEETEPVLKRSLAFRKMATTRNKIQKFAAIVSCSPNAFISVNFISSGVAIVIRANFAQYRSFLHIPNCFVQWRARSYGRVLIRKRAGRSK